MFENSKQHFCTDYLFVLNWLRFEGCDFRHSGTLTFKCLYGLAPQYLVDLVAVATQSRYNLRSRNATLLVSANALCPPTLGDRAFQSAAPKLGSLTSFKCSQNVHFLRRLLIDLFNIVYTHFFIYLFLF